MGVSVVTNGHKKRKKTRKKTPRNELQIGTDDGRRKRGRKMVEEDKRVEGRVKVGGEMKGYEGGTIGRRELWRN